MRGRILAAVVLAVLAGCGGFTTGGDASSPTLTPAPVPDIGHPEAEGVNNDHVDADSVVETHRETLDGTTHTNTEVLRIGPADNVSFRQRTRAFVGEGASPLRIDTEITAAREGFLGRGTDVWWDGERAFYRYAFAGDQYSYYHVDQRPSGNLRVDRRLDDVLAGLSVTSVESGPDGSTIVAGKITDTSSLPRMGELTTITNATTTVQIGSNGVVSRMAIGYDADYYDRGRQRVRYSYRITNVGSTTVAAPDWLEQLDEASNDD